MSVQASIDEKLVARYYELQQQIKTYDHELKQLKETFHAYFDAQSGSGTTASCKVGDYTIQRQIRRSERLEDEKAVHMLEQRQLTDCIDVIKKPNEEKMRAAVTLGLLAENDLENCVRTRTTQAIVVKRLPPASK